jgi:signal transduction histidine kinase
MTSAAAWALRENGVPYVVAASFEADSPISPRIDEFQALTWLKRATELDEASGLRDIRTRHNYSAAVAVSGSDGIARAVLLLGPEVPLSNTLGELEQAAHLLSTPVAATFAAERLERLDRQVRGLDRLATLGSLTAEIAHEIRNPLVSMKTFLQLLPERWGEAEFSEQFLELVREELRRMERLLDVIVQQARPSNEDSNLEATDIASALEPTIAVLNHRACKRDIRFESSIPEALPEIALGGDSLRQIVLNLLLNAIEVTLPGGTVTLAARAVDKVAEIVITDEGPGVPPELRERIFEPFYTTGSKRAGGLGLAITRRLIAEAGGEIFVDGCKKGGAEFLVRLPTAKG